MPLREAQAAGWLLGIKLLGRKPLGIKPLGKKPLGTKLILNELVGHLQLAALPAGTLSASSELVMMCALCGFANFGSLEVWECSSEA